MPNSQLHTAISIPRFSRYLKACAHDHRRAVKLYKANLVLAQKMFAVISIFELVLRNSIDRHFINKLGPTWLEDAVQQGGYLEITPGCEDSFHSVQEAIYRLGFGFTHDALIAKMTFGFWRYQFSKKEFAASGSSLLAIFPLRPFGIKAKDIFKDLVRINDTRNRIAHHEPICFDNPTGMVSTVPIQKRYELILERLRWLGCRPEKLLRGIDTVPKAIACINDI